MAVDLRQSYGASPENVSCVRQLVGEYARSLGASDERAREIKVAVTEAASNAARHAYPGSRGELELDAHPTETGVEVVVRDDGCGYTRRSATPGGGYGIPLMRALADEVTLSERPEGGTEVRMSFAL
jgi:anti-sigma regulatory factor (Ser/Thr protein kinase)